MVRPWRVVRGLGATPKRRSAGSLMARRLEPKSGVGDAWVVKVRASGLAVGGVGPCLAVSAGWIIMGNHTPRFAAEEWTNPGFSQNPVVTPNQTQLMRLGSIFMPYATRQQCKVYDSQTRFVH